MAARATQTTACSDTGPTLRCTGCGGRGGGYGVEENEKANERLTGVGDSRQKIAVLQQRAKIQSLEQRRIRVRHLQRRHDELAAESRAYCVPQQAPAMLVVAIKWWLCKSMRCCRHLAVVLKTTPCHKLHEKLRAFFAWLAAK